MAGKGPLYIITSIQAYQKCEKTKSRITKHPLNTWGIYFLSHKKMATHHL